MVEERKQKEIAYYDQKYSALASSEQKWDTDFEGFNPFLLSSYRFLQEYLKGKCQDKQVLDYGCGNGVHSFWLANNGGVVTGIDLSENSLKIAKERAMHESSEGKTSFLVMDCEKLDFPDNSFDIIFDGGTFSSLDIQKAYPELSRVLRPNGFLIGIETLGHNPITNLKRKLNELVGKRTGWAASHIFRMETYADAKKYFSDTEIYFFHPISWIAFPFMRYKLGRGMYTGLALIDVILLSVPFLRKYAFKSVFIFKNPKK